MPNHNDTSPDFINLATHFIRDINLGGLAEAFEKKCAEEVKNMKHVNIIIAGRSGVGKSSLINASFRENMAEVGMGDPVTSCIRLIEKAGMPVRIYDTVGLELDQDTQKKSIAEIERLIQTHQNKDVPEMIHLIWYCVSVESERFESIEEDFLSNIASNDVPTVLVLTKAFDKDLTDKFKETLENKNLPVKKIFPLLAHDKLNYKAYGVDELVEYSATLLPTEAEAALISASRAGKLKRDKSQKIVMSTVVGNFAVGFVPIPFADAPLLATAQIAMLSSIAATYGFKLEKSELVGFTSALAGVGGAALIGKSVASNLLKLIPGAGTAIGGVISGTTAAVLTYALGNAFIAMMDMLASGKMSKEQIGSKEMISIIKKAFKQNIKAGKEKFLKGIPGNKESNLSVELTNDVK